MTRRYSVVSGLQKAHAVYTNIFLYRVRKNLSKCYYAQRALLKQRKKGERVYKEETFLVERSALADRFTER